MTDAAAISLEQVSWRRAAGAASGTRLAAEEVPVAMVHNGTTTAVMMATPADLEDFGIGFSLCEGLIGRKEDVRDLEIIRGPSGSEVRLWLAPDRSARLAARRRRIAGPTGCGLCGIESLAEAVRSPPAVGGWDTTFSADTLLDAMAALNDAQPLGRATRAVHAAALWRAGEIREIREDVGRHNALDKLVGALAGEPTEDGVLLLTSRVSVEMAQKAAVLGAPLMCAVSAPTALAVRMARDAGLTLVGVARPDGFEVFTHAHRVRFEAPTPGAW